MPSGWLGASQDWAKENSSNAENLFLVSFITLYLRDWFQFANTYLLIGIYVYVQMGSVYVQGFFTHVV